MSISTSQGSAIPKRAKRNGVSGQKYSPARRSRRDEDTSVPADRQHRNLVIVRAGDDSLHRGWGADDPGCRFELIVSYFGDDPDAYRLPCENRVDFKGGKWDGIHALLAAQPELLDRYDYFWLPDDDLETERPIIEAMFDLTREYGLSISQPSLTLDSYYSHLSMLTCRSFKLRWSDTIEIMAPCIRADTLRAILTHFANSMSGFGLDSLWTRLAPDNFRKAAIFDTLTMRHTRPVGIVLASEMERLGRSQHTELQHLQERYGLGALYPICYGAIDRKGREWRSPGAIGMRMALDFQTARSNMLQKDRLSRALRRLVRRQWSKPAELSQIFLDEA